MLQWKIPGIALILTILAFLSGCGPKESLEGIPVGGAVIKILPIQDNSSISYIDGFPKDTMQRGILIAVIDSIGSDIRNEIARYGRDAGFRIVQGDEFSNLDVEIEFLRAKYTPDKLTVPVKVNIQSMVRNKNYVRKYTANAVYQFKDTQNDQFYYWGAMLGELRRNFPAREIGELFKP